jgi:hypothetical protein
MTLVHLETQMTQEEKERQMTSTQKHTPTPWFVIARTVYADNGRSVIDLGWHRGAPGVKNPGDADPVRDAILAVNSGRISQIEARAALAKAGE